LARLLLLVLLFAPSCMPSAGPEPPEVSHRQQKLVQASFAEVWQAAHAAIVETRARLADDDEKGGTIHLWMRKTAGARPGELERELTRIAEIDRARHMGLSRVSEYTVDYTVEVGRLGDRETRLDVSTKITAVDRSEAMMIMPGVVQVIPRNFVLPSKGILERELVQAIAGQLFLSEEMLYYLGVLGRE